MGLVDYSDSDVSDTEAPQIAEPTPPISANKPTFHKVVSRSNPGKIKVSLPQAVLKEVDHDDGPPVKRAKLGGGGFSGFNSFLPAPKRSGAPAISTSSNEGSNVVKTTRLGAGVSLKTGSALGFKREPEPNNEHEYEGADKEGVHVGKEITIGSETTPSLGLPSPKEAEIPEQKPAAEVKLVGKPLMFKPLSVARKPAKKKKAISSDGSSAASVSTSSQTPPTLVEKPKRPKVSLFSISTDQAIAPASTPSNDYQPAIYNNGNEQEFQEDETPFAEPSYEETPNSEDFVSPPRSISPTVNYQSLDTIAGDLNLSAAERRQLFGRHGTTKGSRISATKIINFNTDQEYLHNEELRASGQQVVHNPVRSIAPGKHTLRQLVNAAQSQKEALEESFAKGKSNRAEASSRYGW